MDLHGVGFSNIRMPNNPNSYTYKYDYRINTFPEEVYIHEFLHFLERTATEYGYETIELHDNEKYGYKQQNLINLKNWYKDYMRCAVYDEENEKFVGLNQKVYKLKPAHNSDFEDKAEVDFIMESKNIIEEITQMFKLIIETVQEQIEVYN